ncbi:MAG TPA: glycosyltransferase family 4 protein [Verrucomicrobiota bacterium]|nr:glycosyltransferase family 4 protein [Verrucomicrobiota bacterium]
MSPLTKPTKVSFLPKGGSEDPGQTLTLQAMRAHGTFEVAYGVDLRFFAGIATCLLQRPDYLHFDWISRYHVGRNPLVTLAKAIAFWIDLFVVRWVFRTRVVWSLHNLKPHESARPEWLHRWAQRMMARRADWIRVFSEASTAKACQVLRVDRSRLRVVPEASFVGYYPDTVSADEARRRLGVEPQHFILLWLGSIRPYKGLENLISCFRAAAEPHWRLLIAGRPYVADYAEAIGRAAQADSRILMFPRFVPVDELQVFYRAADVVVLPFVDVENSGSLLVAMGFHKPVVAPDLGVIRERLSAQPALVYQPGGLETALVRLRGCDTQQLRGFGEANHVNVTRHTWAEFAAVFAMERDRLQAQHKGGGPVLHPDH